MVKKVVLVAAILVIGGVILSLFNQIESALSFSNRLSSVADDLRKAEVRNTQLKQKLSEIKSPQFVEEVARDKLGLARAGETVVIIPDEKIRQILGASASSREVRLPNWLGWLKVFWH